MRAEKQIKEQARGRKVLVALGSAVVSRVKGVYGWVGRRMNRRRAIVMGILVLGIIGWRMIAANQPKFVVPVVGVSKGQLVDSLSASGEVKADQAADLTFQTSGKVAWVGVKEGDKVTQWQGIASLDKKQVEMQLRKLLNTFERQFTTFDDSNEAVQDEVLTDAVRRIKKRAQVDLNQTVLDVEIQNEAMRLATISAPFVGIVTRANPAYPGVNVSPATAVYTIVNPATTYFEAEVNEVDVRRLAEGMRVKVKLDAYPGEEFESEVKGVGFAAITTSTGGTAYKVRVNLPTNEEMKFRLGMNGDASFLVAVKEDVLMVPVSAVVEEGGKNFVWKMGKDGKVSRIEVEVGGVGIDEEEITSGLSEGEKVLSQPPAKIKEGDKVKAS